MCNECKCTDDLYDRCSIIGYIPVGYCCSMCVNHELRHECDKFQFSLNRPVKPRFKLGNEEKTKEKDQEETATLTINKRG